MVVRRHGIIGGPLQKPPKPKKLPGYIPPMKIRERVKKSVVDVVIVDAEEKFEDDFDCVKPEDVLEEYNPDGLFVSEFTCEECGFVSKSSGGLKIHQRVHATEASEPEQLESPDPFQFE